MSKYFENKVAVVTGAASGIGRALSDELVCSGARAVIMSDINEAQAQQAAAELGTATEPVRLDVTDAGAVGRVIDETRTKYGRIDLMFNNAGIALRGEVRDTQFDDWRRIVEVNLMGAVHGTTCAYRAMVGQGSGHIVNIASVAGLSPLPLAAAYTATKYALVGFSSALRAEAKDLGVLVSVACPGFIRTGIFDATRTVTRLKDGATWPPPPAARMMDAPTCARMILQGVARNKAIITAGSFVRLLWLLNRIHPDLPLRLFRRRINQVRAVRSELSKS